MELVCSDRMTYFNSFNLDPNPMVMMAAAALPFGFSSIPIGRSSPHKSLCLFPEKTQVTSQLGGGGGGSGRRVWRRRKLTKKDDMLRYKMGRVPFLEEQMRRVREGGGVLTFDIERLMLSEDNKFEFVNEVAAEAKEYVENNRDEYGGTKKAILHVLSNRMNDAGFYRPEAYQESDPFKPGPGYLKEEFT